MAIDTRFNKIYTALHKLNPTAADRYFALADVRHAMEREAAPNILVASEIAARLRAA